MLLRSSSTPVLGSLLSSFSESPSSHHNSESHTTVKHPPTTIHQNPKKLPFHHAAGSLNHTTFSLNSSSISPPIAEFPGGNQRSENGFQRAQSEGNLEGLANASCNPDELSISNPPKKFSRRPNSSMLETIQSFSCHGARNRYEDEEEEEEEEKMEQSEENVGLFENSIRSGEEYSMAVRGRKLNLEKQNMGLNDEITFLNAYWSLGLEDNTEHSPEMYIARGLGVDTVNIGFGGGGEHNGCGRGGGSGGDGGNGNGSGSGGDGNSNGPGIEEHYKRLVEENPGNPLFLRNYAQFLYESKGDLPRAEEYYSRAILADPKDGDILSQYAKLVWELHRDQDRASSYFERAVHATPEDSHVRAAYASFLWETEDDDDPPEDPSLVPSHFRNRAMASTTAWICQALQQTVYE